MRNPEPRYPCPVCLGVRMVKQQIGKTEELLLDHCQRCGGIWFDYGEVQQLHRCRPQALWRQIDLRQEAYRMQCHACHAHIERNASTCPICGWNNVIDCPVCNHPLQPTTNHGLKLDLCQTCKGVWFDHIELAEIWNLELATLAKKRQHLVSSPPLAAGNDTLFFLDVLSYSPDLAVYGAEALVQSGQTIVASSAEALAQIPEAASSSIEVAGDLAGNVFETIANILGEFFS